MSLDFINAGFLGIVEGVTEFLPVSSTGHLILAERVFILQSVHTESFSIFIQLGAILAVVCLYPHYFATFLNPKQWLSKRTKVLAIAITPALVCGALFYSAIKEHLFTPLTVILALFFGAMVMIWAQKRFPNNRAEIHSIDDISYKQSLIIGVCQCASLWPGMSRSASTIIGGLVAKLDYATSAEFSFLIAVPVMTAAVLFDLLKSYSDLTRHDAVIMAFGFVVSFVTAYIAIKSFLALLKRWQFVPFAVYRIVLSLVIGGFLLW